MITKNHLTMQARYYGTKDHIIGLLWRKTGMGGYKQLFRQWLLD